MFKSDASHPRRTELEDLDPWTATALKNSAGWLKGEVIFREEGVYQPNSNDPTHYAVNSYTNTRTRTVDALTFSCTCPKPGLCGHIVAVGYSLLDNDTSMMWNVITHASFLREYISDQETLYPVQLQMLGNEIYSQLVKEKLNMTVWLQSYLVLLLGYIARERLDSGKDSLMQDSSVSGSVTPAADDRDETRASFLDGMTVKELSQYMAYSESNRDEIARILYDLRHSQQSLGSGASRSRLNGMYNKYLSSLEAPFRQLSFDQFCDGLVNGAFGNVIERSSMFSSSDWSEMDERLEKLLVVGPFELADSIASSLRVISPKLTSYLVDGVYVTEQETTSTISRQDLLKEKKYEDFLTSFITEDPSIVANCPIITQEHWSGLLNVVPCFEIASMRVIIANLIRCGVSQGSSGTISNLSFETSFAEGVKYLLSELINSFRKMEHEEAYSSAGLSAPSPCESCYLSKSVMSKRTSSFSSPMSNRLRGDSSLSVRSMSNLPSTDEECRALIQNIREQEYGMTEAGPTNPAVFTQRGRLTRVISRIAEEIYSGPNRVLWELLQNADDCEFAPTDTPSVVVLGSADQGGVLVCSNELGFISDDVKAICDIAKSTKTSDSTKIGKFGVGFKSVFLVTDEPVIYSNNYSFSFVGCAPEDLPADSLLSSSFNSNDKTLPYCCPVWVESSLERILPPNVCANFQNHNIRSRNYRTFIWLPLSNNPKKRERMKELTSYLSSLDVKDVLFVSVIRHINFIPHRSGSQDSSFDIVADRKEIGRGVQISRVVKSSKYMRIMKTYKILSRNDLEIAIKIDEQLSDVHHNDFPGASSTPRNLGTSAKVLSEKGWLYCTFPICELNLNFHINSKQFQLSASRECLRTDSDVNTALLNNLKDLLVNDFFEAHKEVEGLTNLLPCSSPMSHNGLIDKVLDECYAELQTKLDASKCFTPKAKVKDYINILNSCVVSEEGYNQWIHTAVQLDEYLQDQAGTDNREIPLHEKTDVLVRDCHGAYRKRPATAVCLQYPEWLAELPEIVPGVLCDTKIAGLISLKRVLLDVYGCSPSPNVQWAEAVLKLIKRILTRSPPRIEDNGNAEKRKRHIAVMNTMMLCHWALSKHSVNARGIFDRIIGSFRWVPVVAGAPSRPIVDYVSHQECKKYIFGCGADFEMWRSSFASVDSQVPFLLDCWLSECLPLRLEKVPEEEHEMYCWQSIHHLVYAKFMGECFGARWWRTAVQRELETDASNIVPLSDVKMIIPALLNLSSSPNVTSLALFLCKAKTVRLNCTLKFGHKKRFTYSMSVSDRLSTVQNGSNIRIYIPESVCRQPRLLGRSGRKVKKARLDMNIRDVADILDTVILSDSFLMQLSAFLQAPLAPDVDFVQRVRSYFSCFDGNDGSSARMLEHTVSGRLIEHNDTDDLHALDQDITGVYGRVNSHRFNGVDAPNLKTKVSPARLTSPRQVVPEDDISANSSLSSSDFRSSQSYIASDSSMRNVILREGRSPMSVKEAPLRQYKSRSAFLNRRGGGAIASSQTVAKQWVTGFKGEALVQDALENELAGTDLHAYWLNSEDESRKPYDIIIMDKHNKEALYIEVKSSQKKGWSFYLSGAELQFAMRERSKYIIYCVNQIDANPGLRM